MTLQVHGRFDKCNGGVASCNCGAAIKIDDDVIVVNQCGAAKKSPLRLRVFKNGMMTPGVRITRHNGDKKYRVCAY